MSYIDRRRSRALVGGPDLLAQRQPELRVEVRQRFVEEQHAGTAHQGAGQRHPLLLPAREVGHGPAGVLLHADRREHVDDPRADLAAGEPPHAQRVGDVREHRHVGPEGVALEHHPDVAAVGRDEHPAGRGGHQVLADPHLAAVGPLESGDAAQGGRLAAAARSEQRDQLAILDLQVETPQHGRVLELLAERDEPDACHQRSPADATRRGPEPSPDQRMSAARSPSPRARPAATAAMNRQNTAAAWASEPLSNRL